MLTNREAVRHNWSLVFTAKLVNDQSWAWGHKTRPGRVINETIVQMYRYIFMLYRQFDSEASLTRGGINCMDYIETKVNWGRMNVTYLFFFIQRKQNPLSANKSWIVWLKKQLHGFRAKAAQIALPEYIIIIK